MARQRNARSKRLQLGVELLEDRTVPALVASYGFDAGSGSIAADSSGNGLNGALTNAVWTAAGKYGNALQFNGANAMVSVADAAILHLTSAMTLEAWVRPATTSSDWSTAVLKERGSTSLAYALYAFDGANKPPAGYVNISGTDRKAAGASVLPLNTWSHLAATYDGSTIRMYVNGTQVGTRSQTGAINASTAPLRIGGNAVWGEYFNGSIDEVRVYNNALTAAQIQSDMSSPVSSPDTIAPSVSIASPANNATVTGSVSLTANATDNIGVVGVQFKVDGATLGSEDTASPYSISWNSTQVSNGTHTLSATARDAAGNIATATIAVVVNNDTTPPIASIVSPGEGSTVSGSIQVEADATDNVGVAGVQFLLDDSPFQSELTAAPFTLTWNTATATNGVHRLSAIARDGAGNKTTATVVNVTVLNVDDVAPTVSITAPADDATISGASVTVSAVASDNIAVAGVQFQLDGSNLGVEDTAAPYSISWNSTVAVGPHQITAIARDSAGNTTTSAIVHVLVTDTTAPTVSLTAPANNANVSGSAVTVSAAASDNVGVVGVQFKLDGANLGTEAISAPFTIVWDSTQISNGTHILTAVARDAAGNSITSATRTLLVSNTNSAAVGQWSDVMNWPLVAINAVLLSTGKVLMWDGGPACIGATSATVWDPATNTFSPAPSETTQHMRDIFCSAQTVLADGRVLVAGGHECDDPSFTGTAISELFDPNTQQWTNGPDMAYRRWYPTVITLPNGKALVVAGSVHNTLDYVPIPEVYDPATNTWTTLTAANQTIPNYPFVFNLPDGRVLVAGSDEARMATYALDVATQTWTVIDPTVLDAGSAVMYAPGKILKAGSSYLSAPADNGGNIPSAPTTYILDMTQPSPAWQQTASMAFPRAHLNLTVLPDGSVLATGGSTVIGGISAATGVLAAELWDPTTQTWTTMASEQRTREYHSTALLMPDGRVMVAGSGHNYANSYAEFNGEMYSPPYLFKGARPTITSSPDTVSYGSSFFVATPDASSVTSVSIIQNGSVTHSFNMDQRRVPLAFHIVDGGILVDAPADANTAPPGYYMLFALNANGVPAIAPFVRLSGDSQAPSAPTNLSVGGGIASATLHWDAANDNLGVTRYTVYRSTSPNFTPSLSNRIGQSTTTSYFDPAVAPGTYYYKVTAGDGAGNTGPSSNAAIATVFPSPIRAIQNAANGFESSVPQISLAFPNAVTAGDFLIITGTAARPRHTITISDTAGNTFVPALSAVIDPAQDVTAYVWYVVNANGGPDTVTLVPDGGADAMEIHISEWSGINKTSPLDQTSFATGTGTQITSGVKTTSRNGELVFGYTFPNKSATAGTGFTGLSLINGDLDEYLIQSFAAPIEATFTQQSDKWLALIATFNPEDPDAEPPTAPQNMTATSTSPVAIALNWTAATDNIGVTGYNVYRATTSGFIPSPSNLVGQASGTTWLDNGLPPGTFYYGVAARDGAGNVGLASNEAGDSVVGDSVSPNVSITAPAAGGTVSGSVTVTADATDNVGIAGVRFLLDGNPLGAEDLTAPYSVTWDSASSTNGTHTLSAIARDAAGNTSAASTITVSVSNTSGLIGAWGFEEGSGTTTADVSGHGLTGTLSNATWTTAGRFGKALAFNGTNAWVTVADAAVLHLTTAMTLEAWVRSAATSTDWASAVLKERGTTSLAYSLYAFDGAGKPPAGYVNISGTDRKAAGTAVLPLNTWSHLAATYDGVTIRFYVNGVQVGTRAQTGAINSSTAPLRFGGNAVWGEFFNGLIDEVRIYSMALTPAQIQSDMNTGLGSPQVAAEAAVTGGAAPCLTPAELAPLAAEAVRRWLSVPGLNPAQRAALAAAQFEIRDFGPTGLLGITPIYGTTVALDDDGAGRGWFVDPSPSSDAEFAIRMSSTELESQSSGQYDLLTVLMHELGHTIGLDDLDPVTTSHDLMTASLPMGVRRLPGIGQDSQDNSSASGWLPEESDSIREFPAVQIPIIVVRPVTTEPSFSAQGLPPARIETRPIAADARSEDDSDACDLMSCILVD